MSRQDRFDRADFENRARTGQAPTATDPQVELVTTAVSEKPMWPLVGLTRADVGDTVMPNRRGRPHRGIDLHAAAGTAVMAARSGVIVRIVDGRKSKRPALHRAGLFVDVMGRDSLLYRYLHLGTSQLDESAVGMLVKQGDVIGTVAHAHDSGLGKRPHLHFEIRRSDYEAKRDDYGDAINPLGLLPKLAA